jgi:hypothetical protein
MESACSVLDVDLGQWNCVGSGRRNYVLLPKYKKKLKSETHNESERGVQISSILFY